MPAPPGSFAFVFDVAGEKQIDQSLGIMADKVDDWRPAFDEIHKDFTERIIPEQFATNGRRGGTPWDRYSNEPRYRAMKSRILGASWKRFPILRWAKKPGPPVPGEILYPSLIDPSHPQHIYRTTKVRFRFGTRVPYAIKNQQGRGMQPFDKVPLPKREIIRITKDDSLRWARIMQAHFMSAVGVGGRVAGRGGAGRPNPMWQTDLGF